MPNARPRHCRLIDAPLWMDARPVTWSHFEVFIAGGGYNSTPQGNTSQPSRLVDPRCRELLDQVAKPHFGMPAKRTRFRCSAVTGLSWFECVGLAEFFGARLPYELEWEVAHTGGTSSRLLESVSSEQPLRRTTSGCENLIGTLQEWTLDAFATVYFRSDYRKRGVRWFGDAEDAGVVVRGAGPHDLYQHPCARMMAMPEEGHPQRGFRRVWDAEPTREQISPPWRDS